MTGFAFWVVAMGDLPDAGWVRGLKLVAVAVVAQAVWGMARTLAPDRARASLAVAACVMCLAIPSSRPNRRHRAGRGNRTLFMPRVAAPCMETQPLGIRIPRWVAVTLLSLFFVLLLGLPLLANLSGDHGIQLVSTFYQAGSLVFGGGHVVLPLLQNSVVPPGWVDPDVFLAGYSAAQAMPGPLFTFAAFLGAIETPGPNGWVGALVATVSIFASSFLLVGGLLPFWDTLRHRTNVRAALRGVNASVVGVLLAALYNPIWTGTVHGPLDFGFALVALLLLTVWAVPPWVVVAIGAAAGWDMAAMGLFG